MSRQTKEIIVEESREGGVKVPGGPIPPKRTNRPPVPPKGNKYAQTHGLHTLKSELKKRGLRALSRREQEAIRDFRESIIQDLGGHDQVSTLQQQSIEAYIYTVILRNHCDAWLAAAIRQKKKGNRHPLINSKRKAVYPIVKDRIALVNSEFQQANTLGLKRVARRGPSVFELMQAADVASEASEDTTTEGEDKSDTRDVFAEGEEGEHRS